MSRMIAKKSMSELIHLFAFLLFFGVYSGFSQSNHSYKSDFSTKISVNPGQSSLLPCSRIDLNGFDAWLTNSGTNSLSLNQKGTAPKILTKFNSKKWVIQRRPSYFLKDTGLYLNANGIFEFWGIGADVVAGYHINRYLGIGVFAQYMFHYTRYIDAYPLGIEVRGHFVDEWQSTFYYIRGGYAQVYNHGAEKNNLPNSEYKGGSHMAGGIGKMFQLNRNIAMQWSFGIARQAAEKKYARQSRSGQTEHIVDQVRIHRLEFKLGFAL